MGAVPTGLLAVVGLQAAYIPRLLGHEDLSQTHQTGLELGGHLESHTKHTQDQGGRGWDGDSSHLVSPRWNGSTVWTVGGGYSSAAKH